MKTLGLFILLLLPVSAYAQDSIEDLQKIINILQIQRNQALDTVVASELKVSNLTEELNKTKAKLNDIESKIKK